jgi:NAD(P)-dependent dehydrogenase (short-subunit alcohol dehydrogenase family)
MEAGTKSVIVTGASRGIGAATARLAARHGYRVCVNYHTNAAAAAQVVADIESSGGQAIAIRADTGDSDQIDAMFGTVDEQIGPLHALINNAGISGERGPLAEVDIENLRRVLEVNIIGYFLCARQAVRRMAISRGGKGGCIVNITSQAGQFGGDRLTPYAASKGAVNTFTIGLSREVADDGIRVNAVSPGLIDTDQHSEMGEEARRKAIGSIPFSRMGTVEEVAETAMWLVSDQASYVTGAVLPVAGGR